MAAGETTVGGIVGFLRLDDDQFNRAVDAAIARIKLLDGQDVDIDVDVDTHGADADLDRVGESMRRVTRSNDRMGQSFRRGIGPRAKLILTAIGAGFTILGPAAGAATAALVGFTGAVGVGALAWKGFKDEIAQGTDLGINLKSQLDDLKSSFTDLSHTAAEATGPGLLAGLQQVENFLPTLDGSVSAIGKNLGDALNIGAEGLINGLQVAMPLLQDGGVYARQLAQSFADFTQSQDFKDFIAYARQELPEVIDDLGKLTKGLIDMAVALAPVGDGILKVFGTLGESMSRVSGAVGGAIDGVKAAGEWILAHDGPNGPWSKHAASVDTATVSLQAVDAAITSASSAAQASAIDVGNMSTAYGATAAALEAAQAAQQKQASSSAAATLQMQLESDAAGLLKQSLDLLNGKTLDRVAAQTAAAAATLRLNEVLKQNGTTLSSNTKKGIENQQAIQAKIRADQQAAEAIAKATGSTKEGTAALASSKKALEDDLRARGLLTDKVQAYIDKLYKIPKKVPPTKTDVDTKAAEERLRALEAHLRAVTRPRTATVSVVTIESGRFAGKKVPTSATGSTVGGHGGPTADDQLYWLSTGEEVINAKAAKKFRPLLKAINATGLATGGTAGMAAGGSANAQIIAAMGKDLGAQVVQAFADGMNGGKGSVKSVAEQIRSIVSDSAQKASDDLKSLLQEQADYAKQVGGQFAALGDLTGDPAQGGQSFTVGLDGVMRENTAQVAFAGSLQSAIGQTKGFEATIRQLVKLGARTDVLQQFLDKGPESAAAAAALAAMGRSGVGDVNRLQSQLVSSTSSLGSFGASAVFAPRVAAARSQMADAKVLEVAVSRAMAPQLAESRKATAESRRQTVQLQRLAGELAAALKQAGAGIQGARRNQVAH